MLCTIVSKSAKKLNVCKFTLRISLTLRQIMFRSFLSNCALTNSAVACLSRKYGNIFSVIIFFRSLRFLSRVSLYNSSNNSLRVSLRSNLLLVSSPFSTDSITDFSPASEISLVCSSLAESPSIVSLSAFSSTTVICSSGGFGRRLRGLGTYGMAIK